jgi:1-phosphofructokinase family hexose kinase
MIFTLTCNPAIDLELTVPEISFDEVLRAENSRMDCGGKGFNVSRALSTLGEKSIAMGFIGGKSGERLEAELHRMGIDTDFVKVIGDTRTNVSIVTKPPSRYIKVNSSEPTINLEEQQEQMKKIRHLVRLNDFWVLSGSLPPGVSTGFYAEVIQEVQSKGSKALLDSSEEPMKHGIEAGPYMVKQNAAEASQLTGVKILKPIDSLEAAHRIQDYGVKVVIISFGRDGAILSWGERAWLAKPPSIVEQNPIGAGDALLAGFVWGLIQNFSPREALRTGVACGTAAASLPGTKMGTIEMINSLSTQTGITELA